MVRREKMIRELRGKKEKKGRKGKKNNLVSNKIFTNFFNIIE